MGGGNWIFKGRNAQGVLEVRIQAAKRRTTSLCLDERGYLGAQKITTFPFSLQNPLKLLDLKKNTCEGGMHSRFGLDICIQFLTAMFLVRFGRQIT